MSFKIAKFILPISPYQRADFPSPGVPVSVAPSRFSCESEFSLYAVTETGADAETAGIYMLATDEPFPDGLAQWGKSVGMLTTPAGAVYHVWEGPLK